MDFAANKWIPGPFKIFEHLLKGCTILLVLASFVSADGTVSINNIPAYSSQRACVQHCLFQGGFNDLGGSLDCPAPLLDSCICRTDLAFSVSSFLSTCVSSGCTSDTVDIGNALSIYTTYCNGATAPANIAAATTPGTSGGSSKTLTLTATIFTVNGAATTSPIAPLVTVINQNDPNYNNYVNDGEGNGNGGSGNGNGNNKKSGAVGFELSFLYV